MQEPTITYRLKRFQSASDSGFSEALMLYAHHIPPQLRTDTNEIARWLESYSLEFEDKFMVYGFYANRNLVGYAQLAHFKAECLLVVDYLVIDQRYRKHNIFFEFTEHLRTAMRAENLLIDYTVAEVGYVAEDGEPNDYGKLLLRLLGMLGFGVVQAPYLQPQLGYENFESEIPATLLIFSGDFFRVTTLKRDTYLKIVRTIYFKHYERWYSIYQDRHKEYHEQLTRLYNEIEKRIGSNTEIIVNGESQPPRGVALLEEVNNEQKNFRSAQVAVLFVLAVTLLLLGVREIFSIPLRSVLLAFLVILIAFLAFLSLRSEAAFRAMERIISVIPLLHKPK
jgi:hypothetical protein